MSRFLFVDDTPPDDYNNNHILVIDRGPEPVEGKEFVGSHLRAEARGYIIAVCRSEDSAKRIVAALEANPGDREVDPYEEPF